MNKRTNKILRGFLQYTLLAMLCIGCQNNEIKDPRIFRVGVMHSYDSLVPCYSDFDRTLQEEFHKAGLNVQLFNFYTNYEAIEFDSAEIERNLKTLGGMDIDLLITEGDAAAYQSLAIHKKWGSHWTDILCGLTALDWQLIRSDTNIYAWYYQPDYRRIAMDEARILKVHRILTELDYGHVDSILRCQLHDAFRAAPFFDNIDLKKEHDMRNKESNADSIVILSVSYDSPDSNFVFVHDTTARDSHYDIEALNWVGHNESQLQVKRDFFSNHPITRSGHPQFTCLPYDFGTNRQFLAGYFAPMDEIARDAASTAIQILNGEGHKARLYNKHAIHAYMDYEAMIYYHLRYWEYCKDFEIINAPFIVRHPIMARILMVLFIIFIAFLVHIIAFIYYHRMHKRAQTNIQTNNASSLAFINAEHLSFRSGDGTSFEVNHSETGSYELADRMSLDDFVNMIHPDFPSQRRRFIASLEVPGYYSLDLKMSFDEGNTYCWWRARYIVLNEEDTFTTEGILMKIEQEKQREEDMLNAQLQIEEMRKKENFLNRMNHEIRTPLNAVVGFSQLLASDDSSHLPEEREMLAQTIKQASEHLSDLVQDILTYSRIGSGRMRYTMEVMSVNEMMDNLADIYRRRFNHDTMFDENGNDKANKLQFHYLPGTNGLFIRVDNPSIEQIFKHLMTNAIKFTEKGDIYMGWIYHLRTNQVELYVEDSGRGIAVEQQDNMWKPFWKSDNFKAGLGLGLSIVHSLATDMDAQLAVDAREGKGTRFSVIFPIENIEQIS